MSEIGDNGETTRGADSPWQILISEDDEGLADLMERRLHRAGFHTEYASSAAQTIERLKSDGITLLLLDYRLPDMTGKGLIERLDGLGRRVPFLVCTGQGDENVAVNMMKLGARDYLVKDNNFLDRLPQVVRANVEGIETENRLLKAEKARRESEAKYRCVFENTGTATVIIEADMTISIANPEFEKLTGYARTEIEGRRRLDEFLLREDLEKFKEEINRSEKRTNTSQDLEFRFLNSRGALRDVVIKVGAFPGMDRRVVSFQDITRRKRIEMELRESEERFRKFSDEAAFEGIIIHKRGRILDVNQRFSMMYGYERDEIIGTSTLNTLAPEYRESAWQRIQEEDEAPYEAIARRKDGSTFPVEIHARMIPFCGEKVRAVTTRDISTRKIAEESLRREKEKFRILVEESPLAIAMFRSDGTYIYVNPGFEEMFGYTLVDIPTRREWYRRAYPDPSYRNQVVSSWFTMTNIPGQNKGKQRVSHIKCKNGAEKIINTKAVSMENGDHFVIYEDLTEQKRLELQLFHAQKMEAIGTLAGGIAHDFNNVLSAIMGFGELALLDTSNERETEYCINQILKAGFRARDLVKQILAFSRQVEQEKRPTKIGSMLKEAIKLLRASLPKNIEIKQRINTEKDMVHADPTQIHQVIMNLFTNAHHAMKERGGVLQVELDYVDFIEEEMFHPDLAAKAYVKLTVKDTGHGMDRETIGKIFEPYFTTKEKETGTGLGLSVVHGIIKDLGGVITVESERDKGAQFNIYLPFVGTEDEAPVTKSEDLALLKGSERILYVDDENALAELGDRMCTQLGYRVEFKTSSSEALELFRTDPGRFDLVITDMSMPRMSGDILARELLAIRPDIPIIICTGFSEMMSEERAREMGIRALIMKPIVIGEMGKTIRRVLDGGKTDKSITEE